MPVPRSNNDRQATSMRSDLERGEFESSQTPAPIGNAMRLQVQSISGNDVGRIAILSFRALQLYRIAALQKTLVDVQNRLVKDRQEPDIDTDATLQKYGTHDKSLVVDWPIYIVPTTLMADWDLADAIRNYETLTQDIVSDKIDRYQFLGQETDFQVVKRHQSGLRVWHDPKLTVEARQLQDIGPLGFRELDKRRRLEKERLAAYIMRLRMALFGGVAIIVPMLIMALHPDLTLNLVTTSVATVLFGAFMAVLGTDSGGKDVLASTAAYAAVLVVFVGAYSDSRNSVGN